MKLTRLRLLGFKSFVEPTDFLIEPGLTGVVGPNGCGKSNLVEALRWVMGESSHKSMRASSMDDVIFSGNNNRPARNNAEVAISIDNAERSAPAAFNDEDEIDIARRIEREAGSTYRINGREVRARDVQILFADASTGARSPALVHQGRIGEIIQAKPEQRRRVLEEAAGVAGLHARRHEAELRLKAAETNLLRIEDVIGQLAAQIDGLKKQARQAIRYRTVSAQVRKSEATLYHLRWTAATAEVAEAEHAKDVCVREVAARVGAEAEASKRQALAAAALPELREAEARAGAALHRLNVALQDLDREEAARQGPHRRARPAARAIRRRRRARAEARRRRGSGARAAGRRGRRHPRQEARESAGRRSGVDAKVAEADGELNRRRENFLRSHHRARRSHRPAPPAYENAAREQGERVARIAAEIGRDRARTGHAQSSGPAPAGRRGRRRAGGARPRRKPPRSPPRPRATTRAPISKPRAPRFAESEKRVQRLETEAKTLGQMLSLETRNLWPPVIDHVSVDKGFEKALGAALGDDLDAPVDASAPMHWSKAPIDPSDPALPEGAEPLARFVKAPEQLARRLAQIGVVDRETGAKLAATLKPGQRLVSREGDLWRWDGFVAAAHAPTGAARRLAQRGRLAEIDSRIAPPRAPKSTASAPRSKPRNRPSMPPATRKAKRARENATSTARRRGCRRSPRRARA